MSVTTDRYVKDGCLVTSVRAPGSETQIWWNLGTGALVTLTRRESGHMGVADRQYGVRDLLAAMAPVIAAQEAARQVAR